MARVGVLGGQMPGDRVDVFHQRGNIAEDMPVYALKDIAVRRVGTHKAGDVDMSAAVRLYGYGRPFQPEAG